MKYEEHSFQQGSPEWHAHRSNCYNASELAAADGASPYKTRSKLINQIAVGEDEEISPEMQKRFDDGHRFEDLARPLAEEYIGEDLFPSVLSVEVEGLSRRLGVSCDGKTMDDRINWEHKSLNADLAASLDQVVIPAFYHYQMEQGMLINGAEKTLFTASKWDGNDNLIDIKHAWYESNPELRARIVPIWKQVEEDAANHQPVEVIPAAVAAPTLDLPAVLIKTSGSIAIQSNLRAFGEALNSFINRLPEKPSTDQEFADCKAALTKLKAAEDKLESEEARALAQMTEIDEMRREKKLYQDLARTTRLALEKLVTARESAIKVEIVSGGKAALADHIAGLNSRLGKPYMPAVTENFSGVIKSKRTIASLQGAVDDELARCRIAANEIADRIQINLDSLRELATDHAFLFADAGQLVLKANEDLIAVIKSRIADHKAAEDKRLEAERDRIRKEEEARAQAAVQSAPAPVGNVQPVAPTLSEVVHAVAPAAVANAIAPIDTGATIKLGEINDRLGFTVTADFLARIGYQATTERNAKLYREADFAAICGSIATHVQAVGNSLKAAA